MSPRTAAGLQRAARAGSWHDRVVIDRLRAVPWGIWLFMAYALTVLAVIGLSLRFVIDMAINVPVSLPGIVVMLVLAYDIFTITLVYQRKAAARQFALGLASLAIPLVPISLLSGLAAGPVAAVFFAALALLLFRGLRPQAVDGYLTEP
jgi:hypothetical protein